MTRSYSIALFTLAAATIALAIMLAGCGGGPVTGLVVSVRYDSSSFDSIEVTGAAEASGRRFGPYRVPTRQLASGGTVGLVFDAGDAGAAMVCAQGFDLGGRSLDLSCDVFGVKAEQLVNVGLSLHQRDQQRF